MKTSRWYGIAAAACLAATALSAAAADQVGESVFARGAVTAESEAGIRVMGRGTPIYQGDVLTTGPRSFAILSFVDGTRMTLRPETVFRVQQFHHEPQHENALFRLFKGGLRAITGLITRRNPEGFQVQTNVATIGIRGTDFTARLCSDDCEQEAQKLGGAAPGPASPVVGRIAFVRGDLTGTHEGRQRRLITGMSFFQGEILETDASTYAVLAFRDETRVTLQPGSRFRIEQYNYDEQKPSESTSLLSLLRGGLRIVTGLIGKQAPQHYKLKTAVATIGIRGTAFDLICQDECAGGKVSRAEPDGLLSRGMAWLFGLVPEAAAAPPSGAGLYILPRVGTLTVTIPGAAQPLVLGPHQSLFVPVLGANVLGPQLPASIVRLLNTVPRPESVKIPAALFASEPLRNLPPGTLLVSVLDEGNAAVKLPDGTTRYISKEEALSVARGKSFIVEGGVPPIVRLDRFNLINPLADPGRERIPDPTKPSLECRV